ncbi:MAG: hypothetical protein NZ740_01175 [Kiritimatiellae bacterium]|nr:hypothetical protein [Kiritimatiellia bacterium]MDW8457702.1 hypothetical protein [Verrucomicrobiota bacterium]
MKNWVAGLAVAVWLCAGRAQALLVDWGAVDFTLGSGPNRSAIVIDWNDGSPIDYLSWAFYWDTPPGAGYLADLLIAVTNADPRLSAFFTDFGIWGLFVDGFGFDSNLDSDFTDPGEHYQHRGSGWSPTFVMWQGDANDPAWTVGSSGISSTPVSNNLVFGFVWNTSGGWPGDPPPVVPEPGSFVLAAAGAAALLAARRMSRRSGASH